MRYDWKSSESSGDFVINDVYNKNNEICKKFTQTVTVPNYIVKSYGKACKKARKDGRLGWLAFYDFYKYSDVTKL